MCTFRFLNFGGFPPPVTRRYRDEFPFYWVICWFHENFQGCTIRGTPGTPQDVFCWQRRELIEPYCEENKASQQTLCTQSLLSDGQVRSRCCRGQAGGKLMLKLGNISWMTSSTSWKQIIHVKRKIIFQTLLFWDPKKAFWGFESGSFYQNSHHCGKKSRGQRLVNSGGIMLSLS